MTTIKHWIAAFLLMAVVAVLFAIEPLKGEGQNKDQTVNMEAVTTDTATTVSNLDSIKASVSGEVRHPLPQAHKTATEANYTRSKPIVTYIGNS